MRTNTTPPPIAAAGCTIYQVATPALLLDLDIFEANLKKMAAWAKHHQINLRPHAKAHKCVAIAQAQIAHGAIGICCQKLSEAYPFACAGIRNILISNQFAGPDKIAMAMELAAHVDLTVCVDHPEHVHALGKAAVASGNRLTVLPEVDIGQGRCGVTRNDELMQLIDAIARYDALQFGGIQAYQGGAQHIASWEERKTAALRAADKTAGYIHFLASRSIHCTTVTGSGTGCAEFDAPLGIYTELQPGSYVFMDRHYASLAWQGALQFENSLYIASTIMSTAKEKHVVCDVGLKGLTTDSGMPAVLHAPHLQYIAASDEHGMLEIAGNASPCSLGEKNLLDPGALRPDREPVQPDYWLPQQHG